MKKITYIILAIFALTVLQSCGDFLKNPPKGLTIPSKAEDYQKLVANQSMMSSSSSDWEYLTDNIHLFDLTFTEAASYVFESKGESVKNIYSFQPGDVSIPGSNDYAWNNAYDRIFIWNTVINNVMASSGIEKQKKDLKAEALFGRAYEYFLLVNAYGRHYNKATASQDYGVPIITTEDINQKYVRNSVQEVYDKIFSDLKEAEADIPTKAAFKNHPDQCALMSFYAKLYLFIGEYGKALEYADKALAINSNMLDLNDYIMQTSKTWDRVVLKADTKQRFPDIKNPENIYVKYCNSGALQGQVALSRSLRDLFKKDIEHDTTDLRKYYFTSEDSVDLGGTPSFFPGECTYVFYANINVGFSTVENKLIAAECEARVGDKDKAMAHINDIRLKRFNNALSANKIKLSATDKKDALRKVLEERRRENMMKNTRLFDLKRLNMDPETQVTYSHSADGKTWTITPNSNLYIFPINNVIMGYNPDMPQYDRK